MHGSLALKDGVLWVARRGVASRVAAFDLDGHALGPGFRLDATSVTALAIDADHGLWLADDAGERVRAFSVFGVEGASITDPRIGRVAALAARGQDDARELWVASAGTRHDAVLVFDVAGERVAALRSTGDPAAEFRDVAGLALGPQPDPEHGEPLAYVCERRGARVQVFRGREHHFSFGRDSDPAFEPTAAAALSDGRVLVTSAGARGGLDLFDGAGAVLARLAGAGREEGALLEPSDVVVLEAGDDRHTRVAVIDLDGDRVQVFSLEGRCFGAFPELEP